MIARLTGLVRQAVPPVALFFIVAVIWEGLTLALGIKRYVLPRPSHIATAAWENRSELWGATWLTGQAAVCGFAASLCAGLAIACLFSQSRVIQRSVYPYAIFLQTVPIVGIAPLIVFWFGYGFASVVIVAFIISLFPIITTATAGLTTLDANLSELFELAGASRWQTLVKLRLPQSVPYLVTGAKTSAGLSVVGAIVGEIFAGSGTENFGLGYKMQELNGMLKTDYLFAAIFASTLLGLVIFGAVSWLGTAIMAWWQGGAPPGGPERG